MPGTNPLASLATQQVINLLTGQMTDQPVSIANSVTARSASSTSSGGGGAAFLIGTALVGIYLGSSSPTITAPQGSLYLCTNGSSAGARLFVNTNSSAAWAGILTTS